MMMMMMMVLKGREGERGYESARARKRTRRNYFVSSKNRCVATWEREEYFLFYRARPVMGVT
jgi:hypothetical protein